MTEAVARRTLLEVEAIDVSYGQVQTLFGVNLSVSEGEVLALLGTNGAGKSTLLRAIMGLHAPDAGSVRLAGLELVKESAERRIDRGIVLVPGGQAVFPALTVEDNLRAGTFVLRRSPALARTRITEAIERFPVLADCRSRLAGALSGGQQQMLAIAKGLLTRPRVLLIDELSLGLAPVVVGQLMQTVRELAAEGVAVVLVEQSLNVALELAQRAIFMERGRVRYEGGGQALLDRDDLVRSIFLSGTGA